MRTNIWQSLAALAVLLLLAGTHTALRGSPTVAAAESSRWGASYFPNVSLLTQDGATVQFYNDLLKDKIVVLNFIYTSCRDVCPLETARLAQVYQLLGDKVGRDVFLYSITIDPQRDTPAVLKQYAAKFGVGPGWLFLTGKKADIELIRKKVGMAAQGGQDSLKDHSTSLIIGNAATGQWLRHAALENPQYLATIVGDWLSNWQERKAIESYAAVPQLQAPGKGQYLFQTRCAACHTMGKGDGVGPDLAGVTSRRDRAWLARWLAAPDQMLAERDPIATALFATYKNVPMPNLHLTEKDVEALITFMEGHHSTPSGIDTRNARAAD